MANPDDPNVQPAPQPADTPQPADQPPNPAADLAAEQAPEPGTGTPEQVAAFDAAAAEPPSEPVLPPDQADAGVQTPTADVWTFGPVVDGSTTHHDGAQVPHRSFHVLLNGRPIGEASVYMRPHDADTTFVAAFRTFGERPGS